MNECKLSLSVISYVLLLYCSYMTFDTLAENNKSWNTLDMMLKYKQHLQHYYYNIKEEDKTENVTKAKKSDRMRFDSHPFPTCLVSM